MKTIIIARALIFLAALQLITSAQAQMKIKVPVNENETKYRIYTPPPTQMDQKALIKSLNISLKNDVRAISYPSGSELPYLKFLDDQLKTQSNVLFFYGDFISSNFNSIIIEFFKNKKNMFVIGIPESEISITFDKYNSALEFVENFYYTLLSYDNDHEKIQDYNYWSMKADSIKMKADSIQFSTLASNYRELNIKPIVTEIQRKYVVQANAYNKDKEYGKAIEAYQKANEVDPVAYPSAYYNLALLFAETKNYKLAIINMKRYLQLVPEAPDARAAQDKIYEWER